MTIWQFFLFLQFLSLINVILVIFLKKGNVHFKPISGFKGLNIHLTVVPGVIIYVTTDKQSDCNRDLHPRNLLLSNVPCPNLPEHGVVMKWCLFLVCDRAHGAGGFHISYGNNVHRLRIPWIVIITSCLITYKQHHRWPLFAVEYPACTVRQL